MMGLWKVTVMRFWNLLMRKVGRQSRCTKAALALVLCASLCLYVWFAYFLLHDRLSDFNFIGGDKCPACYGMSLCMKLKSGVITMKKEWSKTQMLMFLNVKNIHYGTYKGKGPVVMKMLGHNSELKDLDKEICRLSEEGPGCDVRRAVHKLPGVKLRELNPGGMTGMSDLMACPSQRLIRLILDKYQERGSDSKFHTMTLEGRMYLMTTLMINPEPIIMQIFPQSEGWPFPKYYGACGRLVVEQYVGKSLAEYYNAHWEERIDFAYQVMMIADRLTFNEIGFSLYWTDLNYDNLAVDEDGHVIIVDLENFIVVDQAKIRREKKSGWNVPHYSPFDVCPQGDGTCVSFSKDRLCTSNTADHNYYTACRNLISQFASEPDRPNGLLHDLPPDVEARLRPLVTECAKPSQPDGRLKIKDKLIAELRSIRNDVL